MQTVLAESLGMERGTPKEDTGIEGLSAIEYRVYGEDGIGSRQAAEAGAAGT